MGGLHVSRHGKNQMHFRGITDLEIALALAEPDKVTDSVKGRKNFWKKSTLMTRKLTRFSSCYGTQSPMTAWFRRKA